MRARAATSLVFARLSCRPARITSAASAARSQFRSCCWILCASSSSLDSACAKASVVSSARGSEHATMAPSLSAACTFAPSPAIRRVDSIAAQLPATAAVGGCSTSGASRDNAESTALRVRCSYTTPCPSRALM